MEIGIIGAGHMGTAFAKRLTLAGHRVRITAKHPEHAERAARAAGGHARPVRPEEVARDADIVILATHYDDSVGALRSVGDVAGKPIVEISNPVNPEMSGLELGFTTSAAEEIQKAVPDAKVVKAFNTIFARILGETLPSGVHPQVFYCGDDAEAKRTVRAIIDGAGFAPVDAGPLRNARNLEPLGMLNIYLGHAAGMGTDVAPAEIRVG